MVRFCAAQRCCKSAMLHNDTASTGEDNYGITDNIQSLSNFRYRVTRSLYKWLNRRSQKKSYSWEAFNDMLKEYPLAVPKIYVSVYAR